MKLAVLALMVVFPALPAKIVLVAGRPSHGPGEHEFNAGVLLLEKCLRQNRGAEPVAVRNGWPEDESVFDDASAIVLFMDGGARHPILSGERLDKMAARMKRGVGLACLHYAVEVPKERGGPQLLDWIGGFYDRPYSQNPHNDVELARSSPGHAISRGWKGFRANDEWYYRIRFNEAGKRVTPILTTMLPKDAPNLETVAWAVDRADGGRGFGFTGLHNHSNWAIPEFRRLLVNAALWIAKLDVPAQGARCDITDDDLRQNLDDKPARQRK